MTAPSPLSFATTPAVWSVTIGGKSLESTIQLVSIETWHGVNKLPRARLVLSDGSAADERFAIGETAAMAPGATLEISLGYGASLTRVFAGVVHRHGTEFAAETPPRLVIEATDKAMAMTLSRGSAVFADVTDSQLCEKLIGATPGLTAKVTASATTHAAIVQYYASAWDLMVIRAEASGMVVTVDGATVTVAPPDTGTSPVLTLAFGTSLLDFRGHIDAASQLAASAIKGVAWDPATQALVHAQAASADVATPGNLSSPTLAKVFGVSTYLRQSGGALLAAELTDWTSAELVKARLAKLRGQASFIGSARVVPGAMVTLAGVGARFEGDAYVSAVGHRVVDGRWTTTIDLGLPRDWFVEAAANVAAPGAAGQLPPANHLATGIVKQIADDPDGDYRVLVTLPLLQAKDGAAVWARFGAFYASTGIGATFYPEIGDEVIVAFLDGDPRYPVILGSFYSKANPPPYPPRADGPVNNVKSVMTRSKLHIDFVEDARQILVATPGKQSVDINDEQGSIVLTDKNGNTITMDSGGIAIDSATDITIAAKGSITISSGAKIGIAAKAALEATAGATAKFAADGVVTVKGATVALNP